MTKFLFLSAATALALTGCATWIDRSTQTINFQAVGATEVLCDIDTGKLRYTIRTPQKAEIKKSRLPLNLTCRAGGNRVKTMVVESEVSGWTFTNVANGIVPGAAWDAESGAMFKYPDLIIIDFTDTVPVMDNLPSYHAVDGLDPKTAAGSVEDLGPNTPKRPGDDALALRHKMAQMQRDSEDAVVLEKEQRKESVEGGWDGDKGGSSMKSSSNTDGASYMPPAYEPPAADEALPPAGTMAPAPAAPAAGTAPAPGKALPTPLFPGTTSF